MGVMGPSLGAFLSAVTRAVWSKKLPMASAPVFLSLLDGPWGSDPAIFAVWSRFRQMRRFPPFRPRSEQEGWIRTGLPSLRVVAGPVQHFRSAIFLLLINNLSLPTSGKETKCF